MHEYDMGVYYYERGEYVYAAHVFSQLKGWGGNLVEISPEEYYNLSMEKLKETNPETIICPNCGEVVEPMVAVE